MPYIVQVKQPQKTEERMVLSMKYGERTVSVCTLGNLAASEHKNAVKKHNSNDGIAAHAGASQHQVDWEATKTRGMKGNYWKRRVALHIHQQQHTSNVDCGEVRCLTNTHDLDAFFQQFSSHDALKIVFRSF